MLPLHHISISPERDCKDTLLFLFAKIFYIFLAKKFPYLPILSHLFPQQGDSPDLAALATSYKTELFGGRGLHAHTIIGNAEYPGQAGPHPGYVRGQLRALQGYGYVHVDRLPAALPDQTEHTGKQDLAVYALELIRIVREMMTYVPERKGPEQGVTKGVYRHVSVRMGYAAHGTVYPYASQPQGKLRCQGVYVISLTDSEIFHIRKVIKVCGNTVLFPKKDKKMFFLFANSKKGRIFASLFKERCSSST